MYVRKDHFQSKFGNCNGQIEYILFIDVHHDDIEALVKSVHMRNTANPT